MVVINRKIKLILQANAWSLKAKNADTLSFGLFKKRERLHEKETGLRKTLKD